MRELGLVKVTTKLGHLSQIIADFQLEKFGYEWRSNPRPQSSKEVS